MLLYRKREGLLHLPGLLSFFLEATENYEYFVRKSILISHQPPIIKIFLIIISSQTL